MSGNKDTSQAKDMSPEDTPMALLEQLVYMENFFQNDIPSAAVTSNTPDNMMFNDQLQRELAAFADDTFIFPDEDKPINNEGSSNDSLSNQNRYMSPNTRNDLLSFAEATSFNHVSPSLSTNSSGGPIPAQTYQNLTQRYTNKRKYDYHDAMQSNNNTSGRAATSTNNNSSSNMLSGSAGAPEQNKQKKANPKSNNATETESNSNLSAPPIPSTIHELLGKAPATANRGMFASPNFARGVQDISPSMIEQQQQQQQQQQQMRQSNIPQIPSTRVHVPQGAQNTLSAAGLSQTQIDALASLVAFHKPEVYNNNQPQVGGLAANPAIYQSQSFLSQTGRNNSGASTITAGTGTPIPSMFNQIPMTPQPVQQQQTPQIQQLQPSNNSLLVNLLAQTLANAVQPQQQNLLTDLVVALSKSQNQAQSNPLNNVPISSPNTLDSLHMLTSANVPQIPHPLTTTTSNTTPTGNTQQHSRLGSVSNQSTSSLDQLQSMDSFASPNSVGTKSKKKKENIKITTSNSTPAIKSEGTGEKVGDSEEEKRQRVTAASARFRQKKKMKEQEMEKSLQEAQDLSKVLESRIQQLEMENRLLRNLVVEKSQRRDEQEVERLRKKAKIEAQNKDKNSNN